MLERLKDVAVRFDELTRLLSDASIIQDREKYREYAKEHAELEPIVSCFERYSKALAELEDSKALLDDALDAEMRDLAQAEVSNLKDLISDIYQELLVSLTPKDPNDEKNTILEIRAGTGGDEAALFGSDLFGMYCRYAEARRWRIEIMSSSESNVGGYKEIIARVIGKGAFSRLKYERGVHRVQRVPQTETQGRIHTSAVTVAVLPEAEEVEVNIEEKDLRIDVYRSSGPGGQSVNTTDSAVRVTHIPTGLVVTCQDEKSQHKNKAKALMVLRARLYDLEQDQRNADRAQDRRSQIGTGDRSERIRTYNFPQGRITDHRIGLTLYQIESILAGNLDVLVDPLTAHYRAEALKGS